nr:hypothetical protein [Tanacetum cinerariifolium]
MSKPLFASQVDVNNNLSRPISQHYLPKKRESAFAKPDHVIASSSSRNSSKNMPRFSSNDMVHSYYLEEARKKTQERNRNSKTNVTPYVRFQSTADGSKPKPRSTNHSTRSLPVSKSSYVTIWLCPKQIALRILEVNLRAKIQSYKNRNTNKPVDQKSQIFARHRFSPNKSSTVYEKTSSRYDLRWKPMGRIFKSIGLRWIPNKTSAGCNCMYINHYSEGTKVESIFGLLFDEYFNGENQVVSKSFAVTTADTSDKCQQQPDSTSSTSTLATTVTADGNFHFLVRKAQYAAFVEGALVVKSCEYFFQNWSSRSQSLSSMYTSFNEIANGLSDKHFFRLDTWNVL